MHQSHPSSPPPELVRGQLQRILNSPLFQRAPSLTRLLGHLVERTLSGRDSDLTEYGLGVDVFQRGGSFDPTSDTIVRVQVRRLRAKLDEYYGTRHGEPLLVEIPTGQYVPRFRPTRGSGPDEIEESGALGGSRDALPGTRTPLIGRERELESLARLLQADPARLVTVTGAGGSGKTRLALEASRRVSADFAGGVLVLSLAPLADPSMLPAAFARLIGVRHGLGRSLPDVLRASISQFVTAPTLLLADNFEHLLPAAPFLAELLDASGHLKLLVTSRTVLRLYGEQEFPLAPLELPEPDNGLSRLAENPAVRLFVQRAKLVQPTFALTEQTAHATAAICRRLDGLPLAIELAAARIKVLPPEAMLGRLDRALHFLTDGPRDLPARQQTLRNTIDWSHALLAAHEQRLLRRLAVFTGGFTLEGVEAVCHAHRDLGVDPASGISSLVDMSLVQQTGAVEGEARFSMLATLREYAAEQLAAAGDEVPTRRAHAAYCMVLAEEGVGRLTAVAREAWLARCDVELDNFRSALDWLVSIGNAAWALRLGVALFVYWEPRELLDEARQRLQRVTSLAPERGSEPLRARAISYLAALADLRGDHDEACRLHEQALAAFRNISDRKGELSQLNSLGAHYTHVGQYDSARSYWEQTLALCRESGQDAEVAAVLSNLAGTLIRMHEGDRARSLLEDARAVFERIDDQAAVLWSVNRLGDVEREAGELHGAKRRYQEALDGFVRLGDPWGVARTAADLGEVQTELGECAPARQSLKTALSTFLALDHKRGIARALEGISLLALREGQPRRALTLAGAAAGVRVAFGAVPRPPDQADFEQRLSPARSGLPASEAQAAWDAGAHLTLQDSIQVALASGATGRAAQAAARQDS